MPIRGTAKAIALERKGDTKAAMDLVESTSLLEPFSRNQFTNSLVYTSQIYNSVLPVKEKLRSKIAMLMTYFRYTNLQDKLSLSIQAILKTGLDTHQESCISAPFIDVLSQRQKDRTMNTVRKEWNVSAPLQTKF